MSKRTPHNHISQAPNGLFIIAVLKFFKSLYMLQRLFFIAIRKKWCIKCLSEYRGSHYGPGKWGSLPLKLLWMWIVFVFVCKYSKYSACFWFFAAFHFFNTKNRRILLIFFIWYFFLVSILFFSFVFVMMWLLLGVGGYLLICFFCFVPCTWSH